eukprot:Tamp_08461.p1 GENE.Tamp_08461~~Tamp_08461.p1  ORF type:complete len:574 (+),score=144.21 Tamp_08461:24-1724(+)
MLAALALAMLLHTAAAHEVAEVRGYQQAVREGEQLDVHVYLSPLQDPFYRSGQLFNASKTPGALVYKNSTTFGWNVVTESVSINVSIPDTVQRNRSSLFAHVFVSRKGVSPNPWDPANKQLDYPFHVMLRSVDLTHRLPEKQVVKAIKRNLLYDPPPPPEDTRQKKLERILPYWAPRLAIFLVTDTNIYPSMSPEYVNEFVLWSLQNAQGINHRRRVYMPVLHLDELGTLSKDMLNINETAKELPLTITFAPLGATRFEWMLKMEQSVALHREMGTPESEMEEVRRMFVETNSYLLFVTITVSVLHLVIDILAFKNDISFWRKLKSTKGISVRSIAVNSVMELVVLLYLLDNDTSVLVLFTVGGTLVVNLWKVVRAWALMRGHTNKDDKQSQELSEHEAVSRRIDNIASKYLLLMLGPLVLGYAAYSLIYEKHKAWHSWALQSGVNMVYAVGFMMMTPQLFLNYKYKSVDHLPWRALLYRACNTFIDDLFAFVITMPGLHRMSVFRDDIVFFIYLYQRWIYRKSKKRPFEGLEGEEMFAPLVPPESEAAPTNAQQVKGAKKKTAAE